MMAGMGGAPQTRAVADAFLTDRLGRVLLTLPTFRPDWVPPGADSGTDGLGGDPVDRVYAARDVLTDALAAAGPTADGVRRALRLAIADDLRLASELRGSAG
jgi:hypothetical protein